MLRSAARVAAFALVLMAAGAASALPVFSAIAGPGHSNTIGNCIVNGAGGQFQPTPPSADTVCGDGNGNNHASSAASIGHVGSSSDAAATSFQITSTEAQATYADTVTFSGPGGSVLVSLNVFFGGVLNSALGAPADMRALVVINGIIVATINASAAAGTCSSTFAGGAGCVGMGLPGGLLLGTQQVDVLVGVPITFEFDLFTDAGADFPGASARAEFSNSLDFVTGIDLFNLPDGFTANSESAFIVNNRFLPPGNGVPEPGTLALLAAAMLAGLARRRSH